MAVVAEPTGNVAPRVAGERYEGGKLVDVPGPSMAALDCTTQGSPVPATRYPSSRVFQRARADSSAHVGQEVREGSGFGC